MNEFIYVLIKSILMILSVIIILLASIDMLGIFNNVVNTMDYVFNTFIIFIFGVFIFHEEIEEWLKNKF